MTAPWISRTLRTIAIGMSVSAVLAAAEPAADTPATPAGENPTATTFTAWDAYKDAVHAAEKGDDWQQVIALLDANGLDPAEDDRDRRWLFETWIEAHGRLGNLDQALSVLQRFKEAMPDQTDKHASQAKDCFGYAEQAGDVEAMQAALDIYRPLSDRPDRVVDMRLDIATMPRALDELVQELEAKPELDVIDARILSEIYSEDDWPHYDPDAALAASRRLLELEPDSHDARKEVMRNLLRSEQLDAAVSFYGEQAPGLEADRADDLLRDLARALVRADRQEEALSLIDALVADLEPAAAARKAGWLCEKTDMDAEAVPHYREALQLAIDGGDAEQIRNTALDLADVLDDLDQYADAAAAIDTALPALEAGSVDHLRLQLERAKMLERAERD